MWLVMLLIRMDIMRAIAPNGSGRCKIIAKFDCVLIDGLYVIPQVVTAVKLRRKRSQKRGRPQRVPYEYTSTFYLDATQFFRMGDTLHGRLVGGHFEGDFRL